MKQQLIHLALTSLAASMLASCDKINSSGNETAGEQKAQQSENTPQAEQSPATVTADASALHSVQPIDVLEYYAPRFEKISYLNLTNTEVTTTETAQGTLKVDAVLSLTVCENLYRKSEAPQEFAEARNIINAQLESAKIADSHHLLNLGAQPAMILEDDRKVNELPQELQTLYSEMQALATELCYSLETPKDKQLRVELTMNAERRDNKWVFTNVHEKEDIVTPLSFLTPESALPQNAPIITPEFITARVAQIAEKAAAFQNKAQEYNNTRCEALRNELLKRTAQLDENNKKQEAEKQAEAQAEQKLKEWGNFCTTLFAPGKKFVGEWVRNDKFGELTIQVDGSTVLENAIHFYGYLYDTKLPQAKIKIAGRCNIIREENGSSNVNVTLYDGAYDPDEPTAEVYDAPDGRLILSLDEKGTLQGEMTRTSWVEMPERNFKLRFTAQTP